MPKLIVFNAVISALYYLGLVQIFIAKFGKFLSFCIGTSPVESVNAASNLFLTLVSDHSSYIYEDKSRLKENFGERSERERGWTA